MALKTNIDGDNPLMAAASCLSDAQELLNANQLEEAHDLIQAAKTILFNQLEQTLKSK